MHGLVSNWTPMVLYLLEIKNAWISLHFLLSLTVLYLLANVNTRSIKCLDWSIDSYGIVVVGN